MTLLDLKEREKTTVQETEKPSITELRQRVTGEVVVFCPKCKAMQSVQISGNRLTPTRKFTQVGPYIYHDCGSRQPCRLYQNL
jgi:hypothetical protein